MTTTSDRKQHGAPQPERMTIQAWEARYGPLPSNWPEGEKNVVTRDALGDWIAEGGGPSGGQRGPFSFLDVLLPQGVPYGQAGPDDHALAQQIERQQIEAFVTDAKMHESVATLLERAQCENLSEFYGIYKVGGTDTGILAHLGIKVKGDKQMNPTVQQDHARFVELIQRSRPAVSEARTATV